MRPFVFVLLSATLGIGQSLPRNTVTLEGGWAHNANSICCADSATTLGLTYSYRIHKYVGIDAGVVSTLPRDTEIRGGSYDYKPDERYLWVPFGVRGILPIGERMELSVGAGGLYEKFIVPNPVPAINLDGRDGWGGYAGGALAVSIDRGRRIWLSVIPRYYFANTNQGYTHDRWFSLAGGLGFRF